VSFTIRKLQPTDFAQWELAFRAYVDFYETELSDDVYQHVWQSLVSNAPETHTGLCAVSGDQLIGIAHFLFHASTWSKTSYCYLEDLFVLPERRQTGVGRALIEAVYAAADAKCASRVYWVTKEDNAAARKLYDALAKEAGFVQYRR
jgi:GNAT superfamily N-acetyltransferase